MLTNKAIKINVDADVSLTYCVDLHKETLHFLQGHSRCFVVVTRIDLV